MQIAERNRRIAQAYRDGVGVPQIARMAGLGPGRVYAILKEMGVSPSLEGPRARPVIWNEEA